MLCNCIGSLKIKCHNLFTIVAPDDDVETPIYIRKKTSCYHLSMLDRMTLGPSTSIPIRPVWFGFMGRAQIGATYILPSVGAWMRFFRNLGIWMSDWVDTECSHTPKTPGNRQYSLRTFQKLKNYQNRFTRKKVTDFQSWGFFKNFRISGIFVQ